MVLFPLPLGAEKIKKSRESGVDAICFFVGFLDCFFFMTVIFVGFFERSLSFGEGRGEVLQHIQHLFLDLLKLVFHLNDDILHLGKVAF